MSAPIPASAAAPGTEPPSRLPSVFSAFRFHSYRLLWTGAFLSSLGTWIQDVALAWLIHTQLQNPVYLGLRAFAADAPLLAFMLVGGAVADRFDRRRILLVSQVLQMTFAAALGVLYATGHLGVVPILGLALLTGLAQSQSAPTYQAVLTTLVPPTHIQNAVALNSLQFNLSRMAGPVLAGVLLAQAGTGVCFAVNVASFLAVIVALARIEIPRTMAAAGGTLRQDLRAGVAHVWASRPLRLLTIMGAVGSFLTYPLITYLPVVASDVFGTGVTGYGSLLTSYGLGAVGGALATAHRGSRPGRGRRVLLFWSLYAATSLAALLSGHALVAMALLVASGWCLVTAASTLISLVQEQAPDALRGRVMSIYGVAFRGGMPLGSLLAGVLVEPFGVTAVIGGFSVILGLLAAALALRAPTLRSL